MSQNQAILDAAAQRAADQSLPYAGAMTPPEAMSLLENLAGTVLVDVRSAAEWQWVGVVPGALRIELKSWPGMQDNPGFAEQLQAQVAKDAKVLFMCRSGMRSDAAARIALALGYDQAFNVLEGFEGDKDDQGHRGVLNGWKAHGLPWQQG